MTRITLACLLFLLSFLIVFAIGLSVAAEEIILLDPPPAGYEYEKPEPVNVGGEIYWIANRIIKIEPTFWMKTKEEINWVIGIGCTGVAALGGLLIKLGVLRLPSRKHS